MTTPAPVADTPVASRGGDILLLPIALAAFWTLAYQFVLAARWPAWSTVWFFFVIAVCGLFLLARLWKKTNARPGCGYQFHPSQILLGIVGTACVITVLFIRRPSQDDIVYFHRALTQLSALGRPVFLRQTSVDMDAAAISPVHLATSHEMLMALLGHYLRIDPLYFYQVVGHAITAFAIPFVLYWCVRRFGLERWPAAIGGLLGVGFLLVDSPTCLGCTDSAGSRAFGIVSGYLWVGKVIVWILLLPLALSLTYRFLRGGNRSDLVWLVLLAIAGVGLSNTALYLVPAVIGCCAISFLGVELLDRKGRVDFWKQFRRCLLLALPLAYPIAILALLKLNVIPKPIDIREFGPKYIPWRQAVDYVVGGPAEHIRNILLMVTVPLLIVRGKGGLFLFFYICAVWLLCLNPLLAHLWMESILAICYFRLVYLLPLPLLCAMLAAAGPRLGNRPGLSLRDRLLFAGALLAVITSFFHSYRALSIMPRSKQAAWKSPLEYQLLKANTDFAEAAGRYIAHSKLLAPGWTASCELPLLFPEMKVVAPRFVTHYFANAGNPKEGALRLQAQRFVEGEKPDNLKRIEWLGAGFRRVIQSGRANAVAAPESESARVLATLQSIDPGWHRVLEAGGLVLMLPNGAALEGPR